MTALFVAIVVEQWLTTKDHLPAILGFVSAIVCLILFGPEHFLIPAMLAIMVLLIVIRKGVMKMNNYFPLLQIITISLVTMLVRFSPFLIFNKQEKLPDIISYLGKVLPTAIMAMLVVYCLKDVNITIFPYGLKELIAVLVVAMLYIYKRNTLLSIVCGTICYMLLIQLF